MSLSRLAAIRQVMAATLSAQHTFPFGTPNDVRQAIRRLAEIIVADRRAIFMPSHRIQPETPWENVVAFVDACRDPEKGPTTRTWSRP